MPEGRNHRCRALKLTSSSAKPVLFTPGLCWLPASARQIGNLPKVSQIPHQRHPARKVVSTQLLGMGALSLAVATELWLQSLGCHLLLVFEGKFHYIS